MENNAKYFDFKRLWQGTGIEAFVKNKDEERTWIVG